MTYTELLKIYDKWKSDWTATDLHQNFLKASAEYRAEFPSTHEDLVRQLEFSSATKFNDQKDSPFHGGVNY